MATARPTVTLDTQAAQARKFLDQKVRETLSRCGGAGLGAVLVSKAGRRIIHSAQGVRKLGASGAQNAIQPQDRWCLGSVSKPLTGTLIGILIQKGVGGLTWKTTLGEVFPEFKVLPAAKRAYFDVALELFMAHASGMPYNPKSEPGDQWFPAIPALGLNDANVMERRRRFVFAVVLDEPLGMTHSGWGVTSPGALVRRKLKAGGTPEAAVEFPAGILTSGVAAAASADGQQITAMARGTDDRIWRNVSIHSGTSRQSHWAPIGQGIFTSGPAAACNSSGSTVSVMARGTDRAIWHNASTNSGADWKPHWQKLPDGTLTSAPAVEMAADGLVLFVVALGGDFCVWRNRSGDGGGSWDGWNRVGSEYYL